MYQLRAFWKHFSKCNAPMHRIFLRHASFLMLHKNKTIMTQLLCIFQVPKTKSSFCLQSSLYSSLLVSSPPRSGRCCSSVFWVMWVIWIILHLSLKIFWEKPAGWRPQTSNKGRPRNNSGSPQVELENVAGEKNLWQEYMLSQLPTSPNFKSRRKKKKDGGISWHTSHSWNCDRHMTGTKIACGVLTPGNLLLHCTASHNLFQRFKMTWCAK